MSINSEQVLRKMNEIQSKGGEPIGHWHSLRRWLLEPEQIQESFQEAVTNDPDMTSEQKEYWLSKSSPTKQGIYCKRCEFLVEYGDMKSWRKDDETIDMLCPGCDSVLVEGE